MSKVFRIVDLKGFFLTIIAGIFLLSLFSTTGIFAGVDVNPSEVEAATQPRRVNIPYFSGQVTWAQSAIFWFGVNEQGLPGKNYADVRVAYTATALEIRVTVVDYYLWYVENATPADDLTVYDAAAIYLDTNNDRSGAPQSDDYMFLIGARHGEDLTNYTRQARGSGSQWDKNWSPYPAWAAESAMQWNCNPGPNSNDCGIDYGWTAIFSIPWQTLGLSSAPIQGSLWSLGVQMFDRDDRPPAGQVAPEGWPETFDPASPASWGKLHFGEASYTPELAQQEGVTTIRAASTDDDTVEDAWMGGGGVCAGGHMGGSEANHGNDTNLFVGSETAPTHFPCYNKSFLRFSLDTIPPGKEIISATLTLYHWGNADPSQAQPSWVHLFTISDAWDEMTIHWNNAPLAQENISASWIYPLSSFPGWPGIAYQWNTTQAVAEAYKAGEPVNIALYASDTEQHSSKYLTSSETGDWNIQGRPMLSIAWGTSIPQLSLTANTTQAQPSQNITYTLTIRGSGDALTLRNVLPSGVSAPISFSPGLNYSPHQLTWSGAPASGETVMLSYTVTVTAVDRIALWNQANLYIGGNEIDRSENLILVDPLNQYFPLIARAYP